MFDYIKDSIQSAATKRELTKKGMIQNNTRRPNKKSVFAELFDRSKFVCFLMLVLILITSVCVLTVPEEDGIGMVKLVEKQYAPRTIYAAFDFSAVDQAKTMAERAEAAKKVPFYYTLNSQKLDEINNAVSLFAQEVHKRGLQENKGGIYIIQQDHDISSLTGALDKNVLTFLLQIVDNPIQYKKFQQAIAEILSNGVVNSSEKDQYAWTRPIRLVDQHQRIRESKPLKEFPTPLEAAQAVSEKQLEYYTHENKEKINKGVTLVLTELFKDGNLVYDDELTREKRQEAEERVKPIMFEILKGQPLIEKDHEVTKNDLSVLKLYRDELRKRDVQISVWIRLGENVALCLVFMIFTGIYIYHIHPEVVRNNRSVWLLGVMTIIALLTDRLFIGMFRMMSEAESVPPQLLFLGLPLGISAMVISVIYGMRSALYVGLYVSAVASLATGNAFATVILGLLVSGVSGFAVRYSSNYKSFFIRGFLSSTLSTFVIGVIFFWKDHNAPFMLEWGACLPLATGVATAILAQLILFLFEYIFDVSTNMALLSYSDFNHPLLKRLQVEAPGTYHHSLMVSIMAEQAAQELDANPIQARVCALFHDVGKLAQPDYFTENSGDEDKHKELNPRMSSLIILNHVKEGMELARKYKLRRLIRDAIEQHHGTDLVYFFYKRAVDSANGQPISEQEFRYPGPLPKAKEIVIVALADCCEAACRSLQKPNHNKIDALVWEIFRKKIREGQLDDANLTFRELAQLRKIFVKLLTTIHHGRIAYPKEEEKNEDDLFLAAGEKIPRTETQSTEETDADNL